MFCLPSYSEGLPITILEAMGAARPVVATGISGIPEEVVDGETGLLFEPGDVQALADALAILLVDSVQAR
ncbi:MAG: glycosyltransferase, partial [Myxococcota bacterium]